MTTHPVPAWFHVQGQDPRCPQRCEFHIGYHSSQGTIKHVALIRLLPVPAKLSVQAVTNSTDDGIQSFALSICEVGQWVQIGSAHGCNFYYI